MVTRPYFSEAKFGLKAFEGDKYFLKAVKLASNVLENKAPKELQEIYDRSVKEGFASAELAIEIADIMKHDEGSNLHAISYFTRKGETHTRAHTLSMAYLIGKEKLGLKGEELFSFMRKTNADINGRASRGEMPAAFRAGGEVGRAAYQFQHYVSIYLEGLARAIKADIRDKRFVSSRKLLGMLWLVGGLNATPGAGLLQKLYTEITGRDINDDIEDKIGSLPKNILMFGGTGSESFSNRLGVMNRLPKKLPEDVGDLIGENIPSVGAANKLLRSTGKAFRGDYYDAVMDVAPGSIQDVMRGFKEAEEGVKIRKGSRTKTLVKPYEIRMFPDILNTSMGIANPKITEAYRKRYLGVK
jgi:hypothetical protein